MKVECYGGDILSRRVARDLGRVVVVCYEAECRNAAQEGRGTVKYIYAQICLTQCHLSEVFATPSPITVRNSPTPTPRWRKCTSCATTDEHG